ncbi:hypothetical protein TNCV_2240351 [Trichonephila clavipes]|nr:hypothetical protein TNCV_2240351 [Trichonephila clavipes]
MSLIYADKPQTLDHLEDNIRSVIADIRPQMLEKVIENWTSRLDYIRASFGNPMPEIIFQISSIKCLICSLNHSKKDCKEIKAKQNVALVCGEEHEANDKDCKIYQEEIEILKIKVQQQKSRETNQLRNSKGKKTSYSAKTYNDQTEKIENLEKKFAKMELKFEENNNIFEKKLQHIVQRFTTELNNMVAQINLSFSSLINTMESTLKKVASNITIPKDDDCLINRKQNEKVKIFKKISEQRGNALDSLVEKNKGT